MISFEEFKKIEIKIGEVLWAEKIEDTDNLVKLIFNVGTCENIQIIAGIAEFFPDVSVLVGKEMPVITNLELRMLKGHESRGMILAADVDGRPVLLHPSERVPPGSIVR